MVNGMPANHHQQHLETNSNDSIHECSDHAGPALALSQVQCDFTPPDHPRPTFGSEGTPSSCNSVSLTDMESGATFITPGNAREDCTSTDQERVQKRKHAHREKDQRKVKSYFWRLLDTSLRTMNFQSKKDLILLRENNKWNKRIIPEADMLWASYYLMNLVPYLIRMLRGYVSEDDLRSAIHDCFSTVNWKAPRESLVMPRKELERIFDKETWDQIPCKRTGEKVPEQEPPPRKRSGRSKKD